MEHVDNDERFRSFSALLNDPERIAAVEQHRAHHRDVEFPESSRQIVNITSSRPWLWIVAQRD